MRIRGPIEERRNLCMAPGFVNCAKAVAVPAGGAKLRANQKGRHFL